MWCVKLKITVDIWISKVKGGKLFQITFNETTC